MFLIFLETEFVVLSTLRNSFPTSGDFCCLLITFANSLDPDRAWQNITWSGSKLFDTLVVFLKDFLKKNMLKKKSRWQKGMQITYYNS